MRLVVKQNESTISEFQFAKGPIYIGRHKNSQIFLGHRAVSRQHAVMFQTEDGQWMVEDLDSANKTYLNEEAIHKAEIKKGDVLRIIDFIIEIDPEGSSVVSKPVDMEDTLTKTAYDIQASLMAPSEDILVRKPGVGHAPAIRLPAERLMDFSHATETISRASNPDKLLLALLKVTLQQFDACHSWCALRDNPSGPMTTHAGRQRNGRPVSLAEIKLGEKVFQAVEYKQYMVLPRVMSEMEEESQIRSALIAPIMRSSGCFGVLFIDNTTDHRHYSLSDLDYLMLISIHTAAILGKF